MYKRFLKDSLATAIGFVVLLSPMIMAGYEAPSDEPIVITVP